MSCSRRAYHEATNRFAAAAIANANEHDTAVYLYNSGPPTSDWANGVTPSAPMSSASTSTRGTSARANLGTLCIERTRTRNKPSAICAKHTTSIRRVEPLVNLAVLAERLGDDAEPWYDKAVAAAYEHFQLPALACSAACALLRTAPLWSQDRHAPRPFRAPDLDQDYAGANGLLGFHYEAMGRYDDALVRLEREVDGDNLDPTSDIDSNASMSWPSSTTTHAGTKPRPQYATDYYKLNPDSAKAADASTYTTPAARRRSTAEVRDDRPMSTCSLPGCSLECAAGSDTCHRHHPEIDKRQPYVVDVLRAHLEQTINCGGFLLRGLFWPHAHWRMPTVPNAICAKSFSSKATSHG